MVNLPPTYRPIKSWVLLRRDAPASERNGIIIPEAWRVRGNRATIVSVGRDCQKIRPGDVVFYHREDTILPFQEREYALTKEDHILAILRPDEKNIERIYPCGSMVLIEPQDKPQCIMGPPRFERKNQPAEGKILRGNGDGISVGDMVIYNRQNAFVVAEDRQHLHLVGTRDILCCLDTAPSL